MYVSLHPWKKDKAPFDKKYPVFIAGNSQPVAGVQKGRSGLLDRSNFRMTPQRRVILEELRKVKTHPGADEIYAMVRRRLPRISLGTVYRNLEILAENGQIQKLELGSNLKRFDGVVENHYHIRCIRCDRVVDAPVEFDSALDRKLKNTSDFDIVGHRLEFIGICPACRRQAQPE